MADKSKNGTYKLDSPEAIAACLGDTINAVLAGELDAQVGVAVSGLARELLRTQDRGELGRKLERVERLLKRLGFDGAQ